MHLRLHVRIALNILLIISLWLAFYFFLAVRIGPTFLASLISLLVLLGLLLTFLYMTIELPLMRIQRALDRGDTASIEKMRLTRTRFGLLADLLAKSFDQKSQLNIEIEERKKAEVKLAEREKQYRDLFETAPDAIICTSDDGTIVLNNPQACRTLGWSGPSPLTGKKINDFLTEPGEEGFTAALGSEGRNDMFAFECDMKKNDGTPFFAEIHYVPFGSPGEKPEMLFFIRDISEHKIAEADKKRRDEQFRVAYKLEAIGQLAGGIAHDYNNILGAISGYADLILHRYPDDDRLKKYATMILSASRRASELTKKLLIFARKNRLNLLDFDAHEALMEVVNLLSHTLDKTITVSAHPQAERFYIYGDTMQFQNALMNLALNSRDAMPQGGTITFRSSVTEIDRSFQHRKDFTFAPGTYFTVSVTDTGSGMKDSTLAHLFEPFFTTKDIGQGTGLGLASVYGTMKSHNGFIDVKSIVNEGTTFTLYFPLVERPEPLAAAQPPAPCDCKGTILLVDDETILRDAVREILSLFGYTVSACTNGEEAISLYSLEPDSFDLVILDMKMPGMNGLECFKRMKVIRPGVKALLSTGYSLDEECQGMLDEGILGVIQKPYVSAQLAQAVGDALHGGA